MARMKTLFTYAFVIAAFWIFSNLIIYLSINGTYKNIDAQVITTVPELYVTDSKATYINGYVKGSIKNNTSDIINKKYIKIDCYSKRNIKLGTKYVLIENLQNGENREFEMYFKFTDVEYVIVSTTDNAANSTEKEFISEQVSSYVIIGALICLFFI